MAVHAIIVAAGAGKRFGGKKQFACVNGRPLFVYASNVFQSEKHVETITIVVPKREIKQARKTVRDFGLTKVRHVIEGGRRRQDSVVNGLRAIRSKSGVVIIHDAVRPFVTKRMITRGIAMCRKYKSVILGVRVHDTVKKIAGHRVQETIPREDLFLIQTPQFYDLKTIRKAIANVDFSIEYTDEAAILESLGLPIYIYQGDRHNIKVTDRSDLKYVRKLLA
jgi:2-C-methyl-D-erythritol 4-phosphate cytidylyltransferase